MKMSSSPHRLCTVTHVEKVANLCVSFTSVFHSQTPVLVFSVAWTEFSYSCEVLKPKDLLWLQLLLDKTHFALSPYTLFLLTPFPSLLLAHCLPYFVLELHGLFLKMDVSLQFFITLILGHLCDYVILYLRRGKTKADSWAGQSVSWSHLYH